MIRPPPSSCALFVSLLPSTPLLHSWLPSWDCLLAPRFYPIDKSFPSAVAVPVARVCRISRGAVGAIMLNPGIVYMLVSVPSCAYRGCVSARLTVVTAENQASVLLSAVAV